MKSVRIAIFLLLSITLLGCNLLQKKKEDSADGGVARSSATSGSAPSSSAAPKASGSEAAEAPSSAGEHEKTAKKGTCKRAACNIATDYCCEEPGKDEYQCVARKNRTGKGNFCFAGDTHWLVAMDCNQFTGCADGKKCCKNTVAGVAGFTKAVCADTCDVAEVCIAAGECKDGNTCKTDPAERTGGICVGAAKARPKRTDYGAPEKGECKAGYEYIHAFCVKKCTSTAQCGTDEKCGEVMGISGVHCVPNQ